MGYHRAGFEVVGVDIKPQPHFPFSFSFHQADAMEYPLDGFDVIHASPPCQAYIQRNKNLKTRHPKLIEPIRERLHRWGGTYIIENVLPEVLVAPIVLCGTSFGLRLIRHRWFEIQPMMLLAYGCAHLGTVGKGDYAAVYARGGKGPRRGRGRRDASPTGPSPAWADAMGIEWMTRAELTQAIPPAYTEYIGRQLVSAITGTTT